MSHSCSPELSSCLGLSAIWTSYKKMRWKYFCIFQPRLILASLKRAKNQTFSIKNLIFGTKTTFIPIKVWELMRVERFRHCTYVPSNTWVVGFEMCLVVFRCVDCQVKAWWKCPSPTSTIVYPGWWDTKLEPTLHHFLMMNLEIKIDICCCYSHDVSIVTWKSQIFSRNFFLHG